jgi:plastocyanin
MADQTQFIRLKLQLSKTATTLWLALSLSLAPVPVYSGADNPATAGSIRGEVRISRNLPAQRMRFRLYPGFKSIPPPTAEEKRDDEWQNIVIYLRSAPAMPSIEEEDKQLQMVQLGETFIPHILPIVKGSTVRFPNQDPIFHNVFSLSGTKSFDLGRYPKGDSRSVIFEEAGIVPVFCHLHSDMSAIILVLENPYFAVPDPDGRYRIENIPAGNYTLIAWHERSEKVEQQVEVVAGKALELDITVPIEDDESPPQ